MTNKIQTMLTIALTVAVTVLLVDRIVPIAEADDAQVPHVLIGYRSNEQGNSMVSHDFDSKKTCEAAKNWNQWARGRGIFSCFPK